MSDESIAEDVAYEAAMQAEETETFRVMVLENLENDAYWTKEERDQFKADTVQLEQERDRILDRAARLQAEIKNRKSVAKRREKGLHKRNKKSSDEAEEQDEKIRNYIRPFKHEKIRTTTVMWDVIERFGIGKTKFYEIWKTIK